jgi:hypothetical protein
MARTSAISLIESGELKADLKEIYGFVIDSVQAETLSAGLKSQAYTGDPAAGSVEFKRFANATSNEYGTARGAGAGAKVKAPPVTVNLDQHREIVEEVAKFDIETFGVSNIMARRADEQVDTMVSELDVAFFEEAKEKGTAVVLDYNEDISLVVEQLIQKLETTKNEFVRGVPRDKINLVFNPLAYGKIRSKLDKLSNPNVNTAAERFDMFHGVKVYGSVYLPDGVDMTAMADSAIAQPVTSDPYSEPAKIPLSNDFSVELYFDYGTSALTPDLILTAELPTE